MICRKLSIKLWNNGMQYTGTIPLNIEITSWMPSQSWVQRWDVTLDNCLTSQSHFVWASNRLSIITSNAEYFQIKVSPVGWLNYLHLLQIYKPHMVGCIYRRNIAGDKLQGFSTNPKLALCVQDSHVFVMHDFKYRPITAAWMSDPDFEQIQKAMIGSKYVVPENWNCKTPYANFLISEYCFFWNDLLPSLLLGCDQLHAL